MQVSGCEAYLQYRLGDLPGQVRLHDLGYTFAVMPTVVGVHIKVVSEMLGHAPVPITLEIYSHVIPGMMEHASSKVATLVFGRPSPSAI